MSSKLFSVLLMAVAATLGAAGAARAATITEFSAGISPGSATHGITVGPDGNLWFTASSRAGGADRVGRITPSGVVTEFSRGITPRSGPTEITTGPDGNLWFTEKNIDQIGRITPQGVVTEFSAGVRDRAAPHGIVAGTDGNV